MCLVGIQHCKSLIVEYNPLWCHSLQLAEDVKRWNLLMKTTSTHYSASHVMYVSRINIHCENKSIHCSKHSGWDLYWEVLYIMVAIQDVALSVSSTPVFRYCFVFCLCLSYWCCTAEGTSQYDFDTLHDSILIFLYISTLSSVVFCHYCHEFVV